MIENSMRDRVEHIHFIGVGGSGMCGIAEVLHNLGYIVSGSDQANSSSTQHLQALGVRVYPSHRKENVEDAQVVVVSSAIHSDNPELLAAIEGNIPVIPRALMLAELMRFKRGIAVAGTHGKTTTTSLLATILDAADLDPTYVIGGRLNSLAANAKLGKGDYMVVEADESDASFLYLTPLFSIITNIDEDHMQTYGFSYEKLYQAFIEFLGRMPFYGLAFLCLESEHVRHILPEIKKPYRTYGFTDQADLWASDIKAVGCTMEFTVHVKEGRFGKLTFPARLNFPGRHSVLNALGAIGVALECGTSVKAIQHGLEKFAGVGRRFQNHGEIVLPDQKGHALLLDDYGHHPVELHTTIEAARLAYPNRRLVLVFQPHRYTRTRDLFEDFIKELKTADLLILTEVYAAGEKRIDNADSRALARSLRLQNMGSKLIYEADLKKLAPLLLEQAKEGDLILTMGAGSISRVPGELLALAKEKQRVFS